MITLDNAGTQTCVSVDYGDGSPLSFYGNAASCKLKYPSLAVSAVMPLDYVGKQINTTKTYTLVFGFLIWIWEGFYFN